MILEETKDTIILEKIQNILVEDFKITCTIDSEMMNTSLTAPPFNLYGADLYRLLLCVEEKLQLYFEPEVIRHFGFHTIRDIVHLVNIYQINNNS